MIFLRSNLYLFELWPKLFCATHMKLVFCPIAQSLLLGIVIHCNYSILKQWWSAGYASLLTLSFIIFVIYAYIISDKPYMCFI